MKNFCHHISESTERTEIWKEPLPGPSRDLEIRKPAFQGWIFYDGDCRNCSAAAKRFERTFGRRGFEFLPLQTPWVERRLGLDPHAPLEEMRVLTVDDRDFRGAAAVIFLARQIWWMRPLAGLANLPGMRSVADRAYRWIAIHRNCTTASCSSPFRRDEPVSSLKSWDDTRSSLRANMIPWLGFTLPALAFFTHNRVSPWVFMWLMAGTIFFACKWLTYSLARRQSPRTSLARGIGYLFLWPGMDAATFLGPEKVLLTSPPTRSIVLALGKIAFGVVLLFFVAGLTTNPLLAGWIGMIGIILILHFGLFDLAAVFWRKAGVDARPIMNVPIKAMSLTEFWGRRWNGAFNQLVLEIFFRRLSRASGAVSATLIAFLASGFVHELVISLPAAGGYGLPTAYFVFQGCAAVTQRSKLGRRIHLHRGFGGWIFTMLVTAGPVFWLFHPLFIRRVILPFMQAIHAL